jgi:hypothetical protein
MSNFSSQCVETAATPPDPRKHVHFTSGMVLGVEDLQQEFVYHQYQNHWLARDAIGYGTLSGLKVEVDATQIAVLPGAALSPRGQLIRVAPKQCASLDAWLRLPETQQRLTELGVAAAATFTAYVVLCFRDCQTDPLPIPGEPCRCDSEAMAASRITDDFRLELRLEAPVQREENAIRDFVEWLRQIRTTGADSGYASVAEFLVAIRTAALDLNSPLESPPDFLYGSPPESLVIPCCHLCDYLRAALHLWVTELRPMWQARWSARTGGGCGCHGEEHDEGRDAEECLLLAALQVTLGGSTTSVGGVEVDDRRRPLVVHLRMLQELLLCGRGAACCNDRSFATLFALDQNTLRIWVHHPVIVSFTESALSLEVNGRSLSGFTMTHVDTSGEPDSAFHHNVFDVFLGASPPVTWEDGQRIVARFDTRLIVEDTSPPRTLAEAIRQGCVCFPDLADDFITVFAAVVLPASSLILEGDATGPVHDNTVERIQNIPVNVSSGLVNQTVLGHDNGEWHPVPVPQPSATPALSDVAGPTGTIGALSTYARADHQHPLPAIPGPATNLPSRVDSGARVPADIGADTTHFALADHRHRLDRVQLGHIAVAPDPAGSDVRGILEHNLVVGLREVPISSAPLGTAQNDFVLTYKSPAPDGNPRGEWQAAKAASAAAFEVNTGRAVFRDVVPGELRVTREFEHGYKKQFRQICIRLGFEVGPDLNKTIVYSEDTDSFFPDPDRKIQLIFPAIMARHVPGSDTFLILLRDRNPRADEPLRDWVVRWWAIPAARALQDEESKPGESQGLPDELFMDQVLHEVRGAGTAGRSTNDLAKNLGLSSSQVTRITGLLVNSGRLTKANNRFRLPN